MQPATTSLVEFELATAGASTLTLLKKLMIRSLLFALFALPALAGDAVPSIVGSWRSDAEATNAYLDKHAKMNDYQRKVFSNFFGKCVVTFRADGTGLLSMEAKTIPKKDGGQLELEATESEFTYKVLDAAESQVVIKTKMGEGFFEGYPFAILKFHDENSFSVSLSDSIAEINGREFFKRAETSNSQQDAPGNGR